MSWIELLVYLLLVVSLVQFVRLLLGDADLLLLWKAKYGINAERLRGEVVWITGGSSGIGEQLAYDFARVGCKLILTARREEELERVKKECIVSGPLNDEDILVLPFDVLKTDVHKDAVKKVLDKFGKIDILVNNAGRSQRAWAMDTPMSVHKDLFDLNVFGVMSLTLEVLPSMVERKKGHIVTTSSVAGKLAVPFSATYAASKHALQGWFDSLRVELSQHNIHVTNVCPGPVMSDVVVNSFTENEGELYGKPHPSAERRMPTARCTELILVAISNNLHEAWISPHPVLFFLYISQYMPRLYKWFAQNYGLRVVKKVRQ